MPVSACSYFELGDWPLAQGGYLRDAKLGFRTYGRLNREADNCVVFPTYFTGTHDDNAKIIGSSWALNPERWFVVVPNLFGNGLSTSPSNAHRSQRGGDYPVVTVRDNVECQYRLIKQYLGVKQVALVLGWSMGALQAYQWAVDYGGFVRALLPICGAARCAPHNRVFLAGLKATLEAGMAATGGAHPGLTQQPSTAGLKAFARVYAGWAYSQTFYRNALYRDLGFATIDALLQAWEDDHLRWDAANLLAKMTTWASADVSAGPRFNGDLGSALGGIRARTIVMPCDHDLYFTLDDNRAEAACVPGAELRVIASPFGHCAGGPGRLAVETAQIEAAIAELLLV